MHINTQKELHFSKLLPDTIKKEAETYTIKAIEIKKEITQIENKLRDLKALEKDELNDKNTQYKINELENDLSKKKLEQSASTKVISTYEHRPLLIKALKKAINTIIIVSPWIKKSGVNKEILQYIKKALNRGVRIIIGYGISEKEDSDKHIITELNRISNIKAKGSLKLINLKNTHEKVLIMDNTFLVVTSFNWLSFRGNPNWGFRQETGIYTESQSSISDMKQDLSQRMGIAICS